jgi:hypothetical protein
MLALAYVLVESALPQFHAQDIAYGYRACGRGKGWWLCELGNLAASLVPPSMRGIAEGTSGLLIAASAIYVAWLLLKPVLRSAGKSDAL